MRRFKYTAYLYGGRIFDLTMARPANHLVRWVYLKLLVPALSTYVTRGINAELISRRSVKSGSKFNPFFSDIDLSAMFRQEPNENELDLIRARYARAQKWLPSAGELEIFTAAEQERFETLTRDYCDLIDLTRDIRKISWQLEEMVWRTEEYHKYKMRRAMNLVKKKYGIDSGASKESVLRALGYRLSRTLDDLIGYVDFRELSEVGVPKGNHLRWHPIHDLGMGAHHAWLLTAILPYEKNCDEKILRSVRLNHKANKAYHAYVEAEAIQMRAVFRARPQLFPGIKQWVEDLSRQHEAVLDSRICDVQAAIVCIEEKSVEVPG